jgi:hypothetical protein
MTDTFEDDIRRTLRAWGDAVQPGPGNAFAAHSRVPTVRHRRTPLVALAATAALVVGVGLVVVGMSGRETTVTSGGPVPVGDTLPDTAGLTLGDPPMVGMGSAEPGWKLVGLALSRPDGQNSVYVDEHFENEDGRTFELNLYPADSRHSEGTPTSPPPVAVRGTTGEVTDEGAPRVRIDWQESGRTWEADGEPFASAAAFATTLEGLVVFTDRDAWLQWLPASAADQLRGGGDSASWYGTTARSPHCGVERSGGQLGEAAKADGYLGLTLDQARAKASAAGERFDVLGHDGVCGDALTVPPADAPGLDLRRVNVYLEADRVVAASRG